MWGGGGGEGAFLATTSFYSMTVSLTRKYVRCIIVVNCFAYSCLVFVLLDHEQRHKPETTCKIKDACCKQGKIRKSGEWLEDFVKIKPVFRMNTPLIVNLQQPRQVNFNSCLQIPRSTKSFRR